MKQLIPFLLLSALLFGADECEQTQPEPPPPPPPSASPFCYGAALQQGYGTKLEAIYNTKGALSVAKEVLVGDVDKQYAAIINGEPSVDRRATLRFTMKDADGRGGCTGVAFSPHIALTAAHCTLFQDEVIASLGGYSTPPYFDSPEWIEHPEYRTYIQQGNTPYEYAKSDISIVKIDGDRDGEYDALPPPYVNKIFDPQNPDHASHCMRFLAQGWGRWEGSGLSLRECTYEIDKVETRQLVNYHADDECRICFGDSGGPEYVLMDNGEIWLAGLTRTTGSSECEYQSTHARLSTHQDWINKTVTELEAK